MPAFDALVERCVIAPSYNLIEAAYQDYKIDRYPCKTGVVNQCAVRMSVALGRCGFGLEGFTPQRRVHRGRRACQLPMPHVLGAHELADFLRAALGEPQRFSGAVAHRAATNLSGRMGILYFNNCFSRTKGGPRTGDHIDLWTGQQFYNQILDVSAGGGVSGGDSLFGRSDAVWFFQLSF